MRFTRLEFDTMVQELLYREPISFEMLCRIADKTLRPSVVHWCILEDCLRGRGYEEDIMQEIYLRLMNTTIDYFLLREGIQGAFNDDPDGFEDWMFRVAENLKRDFANRVRGRDFRTRELDPAAMESLPDADFEEARERTERLQQAFSIVLSADVSVYKVLTWLAQFVFVLGYDVTKIKSNQLILEAFADKTLFEMYAMILTASKRIPWITVTGQQHERIMTALRKSWDDKVLYGEVKYSRFFMKQNGRVSGKKSISDWVNRINGMIQRRVCETAQ